jgi:D-galactarolactone cycloisomerase
VTSIDAAEVLLLTHRLSKRRVFGTGFNLTRDSILVRLSDRDGVVGWGETYPVAGALQAAQEMAASLIGRDPDEAATALAVAPDLHRWALGAVAVAIDDLRARQRGVPLGELYRPRVRDRVAAYASSRGYMEGMGPAEGWLDEAAVMRDAGFRALKMRIGRYPVADELEAIRRVVSDGPADFTWMADGNGAYGMEDSLAVGRELEALGLRWFEEPLPTNDYPSYVPLAAALGIPLSGGEIIELPALAAPLLERGAFDIIQPDLSICGGIAPLLDIADEAAGRGVACIPHACNGGVLLAATLQVLAVLDVATNAPAWATPILEYDVGENPIRTATLSESITVVDGVISIPDRPGIGVEVDETAVRRLAA